MLIATALILAVLLLGAGCLGSTPDTGTETPTLTPTPTTPAAAESVLSGTGNATRSVDLIGELLLFDMTADGSGPFVVEISGQTIYDQVVHATAPYSGVQAVGTEENGTYQVNVTADGDWTISIAEPPQERAQEIPFTFSGAGDSVSTWIDLPEGNVTFSASCDGGEVFWVWLYNTSGAIIMDPTNTYVQPFHYEHCPFSGNATSTIPEAGNYLLNINSRGNWSISIS
ncbi:hypothetical protein [Methanofollis fontis]|nr:hypothetical protein [Methanofollis fontis]